MEEATFHDIPTDFIFPRQWILVLSFCYISRGNGKTQANCCKACALRPQIWHKETEEIRQNPEVGKTKPKSLVLSRECPFFAKSQIGNNIVRVSANSDSGPREDQDRIAKIILFKNAQGMESSLQVQQILSTQKFQDQKTSLSCPQNLINETKSINKDLNTYKKKSSKER